MRLPIGVSRGLALLSLALLPFAGTVDAAPDSPIRRIDVTQDSEGFTADVVMFAPVPRATAWDVLTDFDHMAGWVPNVRDSKVIADDGTTVVIEQQGLARFGLLSFPYTSVRQMVLDPQRTVRARQIKGSMRRLESLTTLTAEAGGTRLTYHLEMVPAGPAAAVLSKEFLEHELTEQFDAIVKEMARRNR